MGSLGSRVEWVEAIDKASGSRTVAFTDGSNDDLCLGARGYWWSSRGEGSV